MRNMDTGLTLALRERCEREGTECPHTGPAKSSHRARQVEVGELQRWDLILAMTSSHLRALERLAGGPDPKIRMFREFEVSGGEVSHRRDLDVPDPWYGDYSDFEATRETIENCTPAIIEYIMRSTTR